MPELGRELRMSQELQGMSFRLIGAASLTLALLTLACPLQLVAQEAAEASAADSAARITVQIAPPPIAISSAMLGLSGPLGAQPALDKPICAEFVTEHHQSFTDGNRISRSTNSSIYRDAQGRIRRDSQLSVPGLPAGYSAATFITIVDHTLGYSYVLDPQEMVAHRYELNGAGPSYVARLNAQGTGNALLSPDSQKAGAGEVNSASAAPSESRWHLHVFSAHRNRGPSDASAAVAGSTANQLGSSFLAEDSGFASAPTMRIDQPFLAAPNPVRTENLGEQTILGFRVLGTRVITTLPAGQIGNDRPIDIVSEQWFSPDLELVMRSLHRDPWAGEFTTTVTRSAAATSPLRCSRFPRLTGSSTPPVRSNITSSTDTAATPPVPRPGSTSKGDGQRRFAWCGSGIRMGG